MRITLILTLATLVLMLWQIFAPKGTAMHVLRWGFIFLFSVAVVAINTATTPFTPNLLKSPGFLLHIIFGSFFFLGLIVLPVLGWKVKKHPELLGRKRLVAYSTFTAWILSMVAVIAI